MAVTLPSSASNKIETTQTNSSRRLASSEEANIVAFIEQRTGANYHPAYVGRQIPVIDAQQGRHFHTCRHVGKRSSSQFVRNQAATSQTLLILTLLDSGHQSVVVCVLLNRKTRKEHVGMEPRSRSVRHARLDGH
jgi:hypothetical protein